MEIELIISKVFERAPLWNKRNKAHANRNVLNKLWAEIALETGYEEALVKKKWKYLRDQYSVELKKVASGQSGNAAGDRTASKWQYFDSLSFLKDMVQPRGSSGNLSDSASEMLHMNDEVTMDLLPVSEESTLDPLDVHHESSVVPEENILPIAKCKPSTSASYLKRRVSSKYQKMQDYSNSISDIEGQKLQYLLQKSSHKQDKDEDDDLLFFKSLLPFVARIPITQKLTFRSRVHEVVQQFAFPDKSPQTSCVSSPQGSPFPSAPSL